MRVYGPPLDQHIGPDSPEFSPLSQEHSRTVIPQPPYERGNVEKDWVPKPPILFFTRNDLGVKLLNARDGMFEGVNDREQPPFDAACRGITIRIHVGPYDHRVSDNSSPCFQLPGYLSSTEVDKSLKRSGRTQAKSMQVREHCWEPKGIVS